MRKFVFLLITVIFILCIATFTFGGTKEKPVKVYYEVVEIKKGDTVWSLAETYNQSALSTKEFTQNILDFNQMKSDKICAGDKIIIPIYL